MNAVALVPKPDAIPVAWGWFEGLNILTFALHIILANVLVGGGLLTLYLLTKHDDDPVGRTVSDKLPTIFALTVNMGVAPLLFLQVLYGHLFYTSAILSAVWWLSIIALLILGYYAFYIHQYGMHRAKGGNKRFLGIGTVLALCVAFILTNVLTMMTRPETWTAYFDNADGTLLNLLEPSFLPRLLHFVVASLAIGGLFIALLGHFGKVSEDGLTRGMKVFTTCTMIQMAIGLWWLVALERPVMLQFMGDNTLATGLFIVAVALTFPLLAAGFNRKPLAAAGWTVITVLAMAGVRAMLRGATIQPFFSPTELTVTGEFSSLVLFLVSLVAGLATVAYMLRLGCTSQDREV